MTSPCFHNLLQILKREVPAKPTLFEMFMNRPLYEKLSGLKYEQGQDEIADLRILIAAFKAAGYDYATVMASDFTFPKGEILTKESRSLNAGNQISDRKTFENYPWPDPHEFDYSRPSKIESELPEGMKLVVMGPGGVLENAIDLVGYETLCFLSVDDPDLVEEIFNEVGKRLNGYYEIAAGYPAVGALISNDDWGFKSQTMLSPSDMRRLVFPWHEEIVSTIHKAKKPAILHSCGNLAEVMDDIIDGMKYDGKHSFEDNIIKAEDAYELWGDRIAILGGIDLDFLCRKTPEEIRVRAANLLRMTHKKGGYALGSGNSIPEYVPDENYYAMISAVKG